MEYEGLSEEEKAAIEDPDAEEETEEETKEEIEKGIEGENLEKKPEEKDPEETETIPADMTPFVPQFPVADQERIEALKEAADKAKEEYEEDPEAEEDVYLAARDAYNQAKWEADFSARANENMQQGKWLWERDRFLDDNEQFKTNATLNAAFSSVVRIMVNDEENDTLTDRQLLEKAKQQVEEDLGIITRNSNPDLKKGKIAAAKKTQGDRAKIPADIGSLPAAQENTEEDEFGYLDKLEGEKYQTAIDRLSPAQLEKYENV